jgi:hypothetical protein
VGSERREEERRSTYRVAEARPRTPIADARAWRSREVRTTNQAPTPATSSVTATYAKNSTMWDAGHHISKPTVARTNGIIPTVGQRSVRV